MIVYRTCSTKEYYDISSGKLDNICTMLYYEHHSCGAYKYKGERYIHFFKSLEMARIWKRYRGIEDPVILQFDIQPELLERYKGEVVYTGDEAETEYAIPMSVFNPEWLVGGVSDEYFTKHFNNISGNIETKYGWGKEAPEMKKERLNFERAMSDKKNNLKRYVDSFKDKTVQRILKNQTKLPNKRIRYRVLEF